MRKKSRELALQILFQTEFAPQITVEQYLHLFEESLSPETIQYASFLIKGVLENKDRIDQKIQASSQNWRLDRMTLVDKNVLRIATYEMKFSPENIIDKIAINEAVELAKTYGTTESGSFVNGVLDQVAKSQ